MIHKLDVQNHVMNTTRMIFSYDVQLLKNMTEKNGQEVRSRGREKKEKKKKPPRLRLPQKRDNSKDISKLMLSRSITLSTTSHASLFKC